MRRTLAVLTATVLAVATLSACGGSSTKDQGAGLTELVGTFEIAPGSCTATGAKGSYFRMIQIGGTLAKGPFFSNPDSPCRDKSYGPQKPGTDGGLVTGGYQAGTGDPFDAHGNATAGQIVRTGTFTAIQFAVSTLRKDPQSGKASPAPRIYVDADGRLSGDLTAWTASWNNLYFNQGSPKPGGASPGLTRPVSGTYDAATGHFVLTWASQIVGGPFNGFAGAWHLEGTFRKA